MERAGRRRGRHLQSPVWGAQLSLVVLPGILCEVEATCSTNSPWVILIANLMFFSTHITDRLAGYEICSLLRVRASPRTASRRRAEGGTVCWHDCIFSRDRPQSYLSNLSERPVKLCCAPAAPGVVSGLWSDLQRPIAGTFGDGHITAAAFSTSGAQHTSDFQLLTLLSTVHGNRYQVQPCGEDHDKGSNQLWHQRLHRLPRGAT